MKRILSLILVLLMLALPLVSCKKEEPEEPPLEAFSVTEGGTATCRIIYAKSPDYWRRLRLRGEAIAEYIKAQTGATVEVLSDKEAPDEGGFEILIGDTNRAESATIKSELTDTSMCALKIIGKKLVVTGGCEEAINVAAEMLSTGNRTVGIRNKDKTMTIPLTLSYVKKNVLAVNIQHAFAVSAVTNDPAAHNVIQGGCTDGTYLYVCLEDQKKASGDPDYYHNTPAHTTIISKISLETGKVVKNSEPLSLDHSNDMAYNAKTGELIVVHCGMKDGRNKLFSIVDAETLTLKQTKTLSYGGYAMTYNATTDTYALAASGGTCVRILNNVFAQTKEITAFTKGHVTQGIDCDDKYIYHVLTGNGADEPNPDDHLFAYISITDWSGKKITEMRLPLPDSEKSEMECEHIFHVGDTFYVTFIGRSGTTLGHVHSFNLIGLE